jgi:endonuclease YncB( thermonuclease family)
MRGLPPLVVSVGLAAQLLLAAPAGADWLVYRAGGVQEIEGPWEVAGAQVRFHLPGGTYSMVRADEVDLAASAFLSWQVGDRATMGAGHPPAGAELVARAGAVAAPPEEGGVPCVPARVVRIVTAETIEIDAGQGTETVHLACIDAPEPGHPLPELSSFGEQSAGTVSLLARPGTTVCVTEERPALADRAGHRIVYLALADGRDLGELVLRRGLGLARGGACARRDAYVAIERQALAAGSGHWGPVGHDLSVAILAEAVELGGGASALPKRRLARGRG